MSELSQLEKDLNLMISQRNQMDKMACQWMEVDQPLMETFMIFAEYGQPYKQPQIKYKQTMTKMCIEEHGQPYKHDDRTKMILEGHDPPYNRKTIDESIKSGRSFITTDMTIKEHGKPYEKEEIDIGIVKKQFEDFMKERNNDMTVTTVSHMATKQHGQPYKYAGGFYSDEYSYQPGGLLDDKDAFQPGGKVEWFAFKDGPMHSNMYK